MRQSFQRELFDEDLLARRLRSLGLRGVQRIDSHENQTVMVSLDPGGVLRVHRGFAYAPDGVLLAIVRFVSPRVRRPDRLSAKRTLLAFPVHAFVPRRSDRGARARVAPRDRPLVRRLGALHRRLNEVRFDGTLGRISIRLSHRMRSKLGELVLDDHGRPLEIVLSHRHIARDEWEEVHDTLLHEMIHQWQAEHGLKVDHGATFRAKARELGVEPRARRRDPADRGHA